MAYAEKRGKGPRPWRVKYKVPGGEASQPAIALFGRTPSSIRTSRCAGSCWPRLLDGPKSRVRPSRRYIALSAQSRPSVVGLHWFLAVCTLCDACRVQGTNVNVRCCTSVTNTKARLRTCGRCRHKVMANKEVWHGVAQLPRR